MYDWAHGESDYLEQISHSFCTLEFLPHRELYDWFLDQIYNDKFSAWSVGDIDILDPFDELFDGSRTRFSLKLDGSTVAIRSVKGSNIDIQSTLLIVILYPLTG
jgi:hypothetical protein